MNKLSNNQINFNAINKAALATCPGLLERIFPNGRLEGKYYRIGNISGDAGKSLSVNLETGQWKDFEAGLSGSDLTSLVAAKYEFQQAEAALWLAREIGIPLPDSVSSPIPKKSKKDKPKNVIPVPGLEPKPIFVHKRYGDPVGIFAYQDAEGRLLFYRVRYDTGKTNENGKKEKIFLPYSWTDKGWRTQGPDCPLPFYGLETLRQLPADSLIIVTEGEAKAEILRSVIGDKYVVLGLCGGCGVVEKMDFSFLRDRRVYFFPDNDKTGFEAAIRFSNCARGIVSSCHILLPDANKKLTWDCADAIQEDGWDREQIEGFFIGARRDPEEFSREAAKRFGQLQGSQDNSENKIKVFDILDFIQMEIPEKEDIIFPFIKKQELGMLHAYRGCCKTNLALAIAYAAASGGELFDGRWKAKKPVRTLYIDGEMAGYDLQERLKLIAAGDKNEPKQVFLKIIPYEFQEEFSLNFSYPESQKEIEHFINETDFIILDSLATLTFYGRSNDTESWLPMQKWLLTLRQKGKSVLLIHHDNKSGDQRGTSARCDILDFSIALKRPEGYQADEGARFVVSFDKNRRFYGEHARCFEARLEQDENGGIYWIATDIVDEEVDEALELLKQGKSVRDVAHELGISKSTVGRIRKKMNNY